MLDMMCIDVDGTLIGSDNAVLPQVWEGLRGAREAGMRLCLCTGRPAFGATLEYAKRADPRGWHIFQNGASIVNVGTLESRSEPFPEEAAQQLVARARQTGRPLELYSDGAYVSESTSERAREHAKLLGLPFEPRPLNSLSGPLVRAQWLIPYQEEAEVLAENHAGLELHPAGSPAMPGTLFVSLTRSGVSKASAIRRVAQVYGFSLERVMMVGDSHNDVAAMGEVGFAVAMGNAEPTAREASHFQVGHVDAGGLLEAVSLALRS